MENTRLCNKAVPIFFYFLVDPDTMCSQKLEVYSVYYGFEKCELIDKITDYGDIIILNYIILKFFEF